MNTKTLNTNHIHSRKWSKCFLSKIAGTSHKFSFVILITKWDFSFSIGALDVLLNIIYSVTSVLREHFPEVTLYSKLTMILWSFPLQILKAAMYLHSGNVIHRDQKVLWFLVSSWMHLFPRWFFNIGFFSDPIWRLHVYIGSYSQMMYIIYKDLLSFSKDIPEMKEKNELKCTFHYHKWLPLIGRSQSRFSCDLLYVLVISEPNIVFVHGKLDVSN